MPDDTTTRRYLSVKAAKERANSIGINVCLKTFTGWIADGTLPSIKVGVRRFVVETEFEQILSRGSKS
jgi:hypothetical protein